MHSIKSGRYFSPCGLCKSIFLLLCTLFLISCGGGDSDEKARFFTVGGTVTGLASGDQIVLENNKNEALTVAANGAFTFAAPIASNGSYAVTVKQQPAHGVCTVFNATGSGVTGNVNNINVVCSANNYTIGGSVSGLVGSDQVTLRNNGGDDLVVSANGPFTFGTPVAYNGSYVVTVNQQPAHGVCTVSNATGSGVTGNVSNINVVCSANTYTVGGNVSGLVGSDQVTLRNNGGDDLVVSANGPFTFGTPVAYNGSYVVTVNQQPAHGVCTVSNATGGGVTGNVSNINVVCSANTYTVGGNVTGLASGKQVTLLNNGADALTVNSNGGFTFATPVAYNGSYSVTVGAQPYGQLCSVANAAGANVMANVTSIGIDCLTGVVSTMTSFSTYAPYSEGIAFGPSGNMYVADAKKNVIYKVTPDGQITIFAGQSYPMGVAPFKDGTGTDAHFFTPRGIAIDANENIYVADSDNHVVRKITPAGVVSLYAGQPNSYGNNDGPLGTGKLYRPNAIAVDANGVLYVTDMNYKIRKITPDQEISTVASTVGASFGMVIDPGGFTDSNPIFYITDYVNNAIYKIDRNGTRTIIAGVPGYAGYADGPASTALFYKPTGLVKDIYGALYVADYSFLSINDIGHSIRKITPDGNVSTLAGSGLKGYADGVGPAAQFANPKGLAIDTSGTIYVGDQDNRQIRIIK